MKNKKRQQGFTLVELAIVLVIVGVLMGGFIGALSSRIDNTRIANTKDDLENIKEVLIGFAYSTNAPYLPCPDCTAACAGGAPSDGREDRNGNACSVGIGALPWVTLGIAGSDEWGTRYSYWVDPSFSNNLPANYFTLTTTAVGEVFERSDDGAATQTLADNTAAVVYSHGKNGYGGVSTSGATITGAPDANGDGIPDANDDEEDNVNNDNDFVSRPPSAATAATAGGEFDDIVIWISEYELKAKMVEAGVLP